MKKSIIRSLLFIALTVLLISRTWASTITLDFSELPPQTIDDVSIVGVTFDFKIEGLDSSLAGYNSSGPGIVEFVQDPSLVGNPEGILTLDFVSPTPILEFGVAFPQLAPIPLAFTIELFDSALMSLGISQISASSAINSFSEAHFSYEGISVKRAVIDFEVSTGGFALDNLTFAAVPIPPALLLFGSGLFGLLGFGRFKNKSFK